MIRVAEKNVYGDGMKPETSTVPELLEAGIRLQANLAQGGFEIRPFKAWAGALPDVAVFWDCPRIDDPDLRRCLAQGVPFLLVISENFHLQPHATYQELKPLARKILTYDLDEVDGQKVFWLPYSLDMKAGRQNRELALKQARPHLLGMVNSWKKSEIPGDLYQKRNRLAIQAGKILKGEMFLAGSGWDRHIVHSLKWQRSFAKRCPALARRLFQWPNSAYRGVLELGKAKLQALATCEFALVPENCSSLRGYITEKIFNALFAGCIPIYQGHPEATRWLPPETFLPMERFRSGEQLVRFLRAMTREEKEAYLGAGARFLEAGATEFFDVDKYVDVFRRHLESTLPESKARPAADFQR
ncbi:Glycosyl transferase family 10 [Candidatus Methylacidiphilaceae bacterium]